MTSLGAFFDSSSLLKLKENEPSGIGRIAVADAGFQLFISGPTSSTVCNKMSTFIQRDFLAPQKTFNIFFAIFHVKLKLNVVKQHRTAVFSRFFFYIYLVKS